MTERKGREGGTTGRGPPNGRKERERKREREREEVIQEII
jgi:hypothetical protein